MTTTKLLGRFSGGFGSGSGCTFRKSSIAERIQRRIIIKKLKLAYLGKAAQTDLAQKVT